MIVRRFDLTLLWRRPLSYRNHSGFYMITSSVMKGLSEKFDLSWIAIIFPLPLTKTSKKLFTKKSLKFSKNFNKYRTMQMFTNGSEIFVWNTLIKTHLGLAVFYYFFHEAVVWWLVHRSFSIVTLIQFPWVTYYYFRIRTYKWGAPASICLFH